MLDETSWTQEKSVGLNLLNSGEEFCIQLVTQKCVGLSLLDTECWIKLVGLRRSVGLSLLDSGEECWIKLVGPRRRMLD